MFIEAITYLIMLRTFKAVMLRCVLPSSQNVWPGPD